MRTLFMISATLIFFAVLEGDTLILINNYQISSYGSDVWGYFSPDGTEYALMGTLNGIAIINIDSGEVVDYVQGPQTSWRDIKTYQNYAYVSSEGMGFREGIQIIDLSYLPDSAHFVTSYIYGDQITSHNIFIDTINGFLYAMRSWSDGVRIIDITNPTNPIELPYVPTPGAHDVFVINDTLYVAEGFNYSFSIWDVTDKSNPVFINRVYIPNGGFSHNIWVNETQTIAATTEEEPHKTVKVWDISDKSNISLLGEYLGGNNLAHNVILKGNRLYISHYTYGVAVVDISDPQNPMEIGHYDTYPWSNEPDYEGCWGVFPFTENGYIHASNMNGRLFVLYLDTTQTIVYEETEEPTYSVSYSIYPGKIVFSINSAIQDNIRLILYNKTGRKVYTVKKRLNRGRNTIPIELKGMPKDVYFYKIHTNKRFYRGKILYF